ncbi:hypothetical protein HHA02_14660 [Cobetia marina]|nr:hypothetical protein HHA02_14660 [Cobetia marina]
MSVPDVETGGNLRHRCKVVAKARPSFSGTGRVTLSWTRYGARMNDFKALEAAYCARRRADSFSRFRQARRETTGHPRGVP